MRRTKMFVLLALVCVLFIGRGFAQIEPPPKGLEKPEIAFFESLVLFGPNDVRTVGAYVDAHSTLLDSAQSVDEVVETLLRYQNVVNESQLALETSKTNLLLNFHLCLAHR